MFESRCHLWPHVSVYVCVGIPNADVVACTNKYHELVPLNMDIPFQDPSQALRRLQIAVLQQPSPNTPK